jgi:hypothetical protein
MKGFRTAEAAAREDIPERYARVLDVSFAPGGDHAVVLLETNEPPAVELYQVVCEKEGDEWLSVAGGNGPGETSFDDDVWVRTFWDEAPDGSPTLRTEWRRAQ